VILPRSGRSLKKLKKTSVKNIHVLLAIKLFAHWIPLGVVIGVTHFILPETDARASLYQVIAGGVRFGFNWQATPLTPRVLQKAG